MPLDIYLAMLTELPYGGYLVVPPNYKLYLEKLRTFGLCFALLVYGLGFAQALKESNGCGPQYSPLLAALIPEGPLPLSVNAFHEACNAHDLCYDLSEERTQVACDEALLEDLLSVCERDFEDSSYCLWMANQFFLAVERGGERSVKLPEAPYVRGVEVKGVAHLELLSQDVVEGRFKDEFSLCVKIHNTNRFNTYFRLYLYAASERDLGEKPEGDLWLAWAPLHSDMAIFLRANETTERCLSTAGFIGVARSAADFGGRYRLELWVYSARPDIGVKLADSIEGDVY